MNKIFEELVSKWPSSLVSRAEVGRFTGGAISGKSLANLQSLGEPVPPSIRIGGKVVYEAVELAVWLEGRCK